MKLWPQNLNQLYYAYKFTVHHILLIAEGLGKYKGNIFQFKSNCNLYEGCAIPLSIS